jgi:membrane protease subunit HflK
MRYRWLFLVLLLVGYGLTGFVQVRPGERAVVRRFGRVLPDKPGPGLWIGLPWGMDRVDRVAVDKIQSVTVGYQEDVADEAIPAGQLLTGDHNLVNIQVRLTYKVKAEEVDEYITQIDRVEGLIARAAEAVLAQWVATRTVDDVLLNAKTALRTVLTNGTRSRLVDYRLGVEILDTRVSLVAPPDDVKPAFDRVVSAQTAIKTQELKAEQEARALEQIASSDRNRLELETKDYVRKVKELGDVRVKTFLGALTNYEAAKATNPNYLRQMWDRDMITLLKQMQKNGQDRVGVLDDLLHNLGLGLNTMQGTPKK